MSRLLLILCTLCAVSILLRAQVIDDRRFRVGFYNMENYFDPFSDSLHPHVTYVPKGERYWSWDKVKRKRNNIYKTIVSMGGWQDISLLGLAEVENAWVLEDLIQNSPLKQSNYDYIHVNSYDHRGLDVALLYQVDHFQVFRSKAIPILDSLNMPLPTRSILYVGGILAGDTLHIYINHWTSRYRGILQSQPLRMAQSQLLIQCLDTIIQSDPEASILLMGDFNDQITDKSMKQLLDANNLTELIPIPLVSGNKMVKGSLKYRGDWVVFDHLLMNQNLKNHQRLKVDSLGHIYSAPFLLQKDEKYLGIEPLRNYKGFKYQNGFSDHLPIFVDIYTQ